MIAEPLSVIYLRSINSSKLPSQWLTADITPIFKKGVSSDPSNYRPVSLTSVCCKVLESIINDNLIKYLKDHSIISKTQHGFLKRRSTCSQLLECVSDWSRALDEGFPSDVIYIDFAKAFDSVSHPKLLHKLKAYGIRGILHNWFSSFLSNRSQRVKIEEYYSGYTEVLSGVPQGSVLGPLLFLIFINDLELVLPHVKMKLFADDVKIYSTLKVPYEADSLTIQSSLNELQSWALCWQLKVSEPKCNVLHIGNKNPNNTYTINQHDLPAVTNCRDLGVIISNNLKFKDHCLSIVAKAYKMTNILFRCFQTANKQALLTAYKAYVVPILEYCSPVWSSQFLLDIDMIERVQRYFSRRLFARLGLNPETPYIQRLAFLRLDPLELRRIRHDLVFCYKIVHHDIDLNFNDFFELRPTNSLTTRGHSLCFYIKQARIDVLKDSFAFRSAPVWNSLPEYISGFPLVRAANISLFKKRLKLVDLNRFLKFNRNLI